MELCYDLIEAVSRRFVPDDLDFLNDLDYPILDATMQEFMTTLYEVEEVPAEIFLRDSQVIVDAFDSIQKKIDDEEQERLVSEKGS